MATKKVNLIQIWLRGAVEGGFGPALSEFDATGVPAPVASSVESCSHLANHQASASHNGIMVSSAFLAPRTNAVTTEHAIPRSWSSQARLLRKEFQQLDLAGAYQGFPRGAFPIYRHK
jgi:hypothetical protein